MNRTSSSPHLRDGIPQDEDALIALDSVAATDPRRIMQIGDWLAHGGVQVAEQNGRSLATWSPITTSSAKPSLKC